MSGFDIAAEVSAALAEVAQEVGDGSFSVTLIRPSTQPVNPWDTPADEPTLYPLNAMVQAFRQDQIDGTLIQAGDRKVMIEATSVVPTTADRITLPEGEFSILSVEPLSPSGVALFYDLHCRR